MAANEVRIEISADSRGVDRAISDVGKRFDRMGQRMRSVGKGMTMGLTLPIVGLGVVAVKMGADFEKSMNQVRAVSGAAGAQFEALRDQAKELGRTTQYSASQAAEAMNFLAMAGFEANEVIGAMPSTLQLAAAGQMDLAQAADIASNILTGYQMTTEELGHANDVLVKTFTSTNTNLIQLGEAFKMVAPVASSAGLQFEEVSAAVGLLGNAGIQATMAGTSLRGAIVRLLTPTEEAKDVMGRLGLNVIDASGNLVSLEEIVRQLESSGASTADMMEIFGQRAGPGMAALVGQGADALKGLTAELTDSGGTAKKIADVQMEGFTGAMRRMRSALEGAAIAFVESGLLDLLGDLAGQVAKVAEKMANLPKPVLVTIGVIAGLAAAVGPMLLAFGMILSMIPKLILAFRALRIAASTALGPWGLLLGAATAIGGGFLLNKLMSGGSKVPGLQHGGGLPEGLSMVGEAGAEFALKRGSQVSIIPAGKIPGFQGGTGTEEFVRQLRRLMRPEPGAWQPWELPQMMRPEKLAAMPPWYTIPPDWLTERGGVGLEFGMRPARPAGPGAVEGFGQGALPWGMATGDVDRAWARFLGLESWQALHENVDDMTSALHDVNPPAVDFLKALEDVQAPFREAQGGVKNIGDELQDAITRGATAQQALWEAIGLGNQAGFSYVDTLGTLTDRLGDAGLATQVAGQMLDDHLNASLRNMAEQLPGGATVLQAMTDAGMTLEEQFKMLYEATGGVIEVVDELGKSLDVLREEQMAGIRETVAALPSVIKTGVGFAPGTTGAGAWAALAAGGGPMHGVGGVAKTLADLGITTPAAMPVMPGTFGKSQLQENATIIVNFNGDTYGMVDFEDKVTAAVVQAKAGGASV